MRSLADASLSQEFKLGLSQFNKRQFFDCHETLEDVWKELEGDEKEITQAVIQIAVGYYHLSRNNTEGARKLLKRGFERLAPFSDWKNSKESHDDGCDGNCPSDLSDLPARSGRDKRPLRALPETLAYIDIDALKAHVRGHLQSLESGSVPDSQDLPTITNRLEA